MLRSVLCAYVESEKGECKKFTDGKLVSGRPKTAALGLSPLLGLDDRALWRGMSEGLENMLRELERGASSLTPTEDDPDPAATLRECVQYIVHQRAGENQRKWKHSGWRIMDHFSNSAEEDGRANQGLEYFVQHPKASEAHLLEEHVVALRLYTTAAYPSLIQPLRDKASPGTAASPHPFPITVALIADGIKRLRAVGAERAEANSARTFWRGVRNLKLPKDFLRSGGTEYAMMSTSASLQVALDYCNHAEKRLLLKVETSSFIEWGADLRFLSAFPDEVEFLYSPLTFLEPLGKVEVVRTLTGVEYTVIAVRPHFPT